MGAEFEVEAQGDHEYLVRVSSEEAVESCVRVDPGVLEQLGLGLQDEGRAVHRTVEFLVKRQDAADLPPLIELEDVLAAYEDFAAAVSS